MWGKTPQLSALEPEEFWDGWPPGKSWLPGASPGSDDWCYVIRSPHFTSFNPTSSPLWASPDAMSAKWTIQKSWEISQLRLPLMEMIIRLNDLLNAVESQKWYLVPTCQRDVRSFLGFTGYYRRFIENFTKITSPLFKLLTKDYEFT